MRRLAEHETLLARGQANDALWRLLSEGEHVALEESPDDVPVGFLEPGG